MGILNIGVTLFIGDEVPDNTQIIPLTCNVKYILTSSPLQERKYCGSEQTRLSRIGKIECKKC